MSVISVSVVDIIWIGWVISRLKLILVLIVMKKMLSNNFLEEVRLFFSLCWYLLLVRMILVRKVFSVGDRLI